MDKTKAEGLIPTRVLITWLALILPLLCIAVLIAVVAPIIATVIFTPPAVFLWVFGRRWAPSAGAGLLAKHSSSLLGVCVALGWVVEGGQCLMA